MMSKVAYNKLQSVIGEIKMAENLSIHVNNSELENYKAISDVVNNVDWYRVHNVMKFLQWGWGIEDEVPEIYQLRKEATDQAERVVRYSIKTKNNGYTECGGIRTRTHVFDDGSILLDTAFVLSSWDNSI